MYWSSTTTGVSPATSAVTAGDAASATGGGGGGGAGSVIVNTSSPQFTAVAGTNGTGGGGGGGANSGTAYNTTVDNPQVLSPQNFTNIPAYTVNQFTGQVYTRVRGRQMAFRIGSNTIGVAWQLGVPRIDVKPAGKR